MRRGVFEASELGLYFGRFSLDHPFEESQQMADIGVFANFAITRPCGHFWCPGLQQKVVR